MTLIVGARALYAQADRADPHHAAVVEVLRAEPGPLVTSQTALAEADYLVLTRLGVDVELLLIRDVASGTFAADCLTREELSTAGEVVQRYRALELGLADATLVVLAQRHRTKRILTFDERAFRAVQPLQGGAFHLLPADR